VIGAVHILLIIAIVFFLIVTFNLSDVTGAAVTDIVSKLGPVGTILIILAASAIIGFVAHYAISGKILGRKLVETEEQKIDYWTRYSMQKLKWGQKKKETVPSKETTVYTTEKTAQIPDKPKSPEQPKTTAATDKPKTVLVKDQKTWQIPQKPKTEPAIKKTLTPPPQTEKPTTNIFAKDTEAIDDRIKKKQERR